jgi:CBS domain-containing protein
MSVVFELMKKNPISISEDATILDAARILTEESVGVLIVARGGKITGVLSEKDVVAKCVAAGKNAAEIHVSDIMSQSPVTVTPETSVEQCLEYFLSKGFRHLPVVSSNGKIQGMISSRDFLPHIKNKLGKAMDNENYLRFIELLESV